MYSSSWMNTVQKYVLCFICGLQNTDQLSNKLSTLIYIKKDTVPI